MPTLNLRDSGNFLSRCSSFMYAQGKDPNLEGDRWISEYLDGSISDATYNANVTTFDSYFDAWLNGALVLTANSGGTYTPPVGSAPPRVTPRPRP